MAALELARMYSLYHAQGHRSHQRNSNTHHRNRNHCGIYMDNLDSDPLEYEYTHLYQGHRNLTFQDYHHHSPFHHCGTHHSHKCLLYMRYYHYNPHQSDMSRAHKLRIYARYSKYHYPCVAHGLLLSDTNHPAEVYPGTWISRQHLQQAHLYYMFHRYSHVHLSGHV